MFATKSHMDVSFLAGPDKKIIKAHRSVLTAALEDFDLIFSESFRENDDSTIVLNEIEPEIIESIIEFVYCGVIEIPDMETAFQLWELVHMMGIESLQGHIVKYMKSNITTNNCWGVYLLAKKYEENHLASFAVAFAVSNIDSLIHLNKNHLVEYIVTAKERDVIEDQIVKTALIWLNFNGQREEYLREILYLLDIEKINDLSLIDELEAMCTEVDLVKYISSGLKQRCLKSTNPITPKNNATKDIIAVIQHANNGKTKTISEFDVRSGVVLSEETVDCNGTVLGIWKEALIILQIESDQSKITSYGIKTKVFEEIGDYDIASYMDSTILDGDLYIVTENYCYIINLISGCLLNTLESPPSFKFRGVTTNKNAIYFTLFKRDQQNVHVAYYNKTFGKIEPFESSLNNFKFIFTKCIGHNDLIYIFSMGKIVIFNLLKNRWDYQSKMEIFPVSDAVTSTNKLIVIHDNILREFNPIYKFSELPSSFTFLENDSQIFSL